jgi:hypothetical protein
MVAGQAITTQAQTKEFDEGYERVFGKGGGERGRFVWSESAQAMVRVGEDWTDAERRAQTVTEELVHGKIATADGVDISSRKKRRDYMRAAGVVDSSDYSPEWREKKKKEIERTKDEGRRSDIVETYRSLKRY